MILERLVVEQIRPSNTVESLETEEKGKDLVARVSMRAIDVLILLVALVVSWDCNSKISGPMKLIYILYAIMFPSLYLTFYLVYRIILGNPCY